MFKRLLFSLLVCSKAYSFVLIEYEKGEKARASQLIKKIENKLLIPRALVFKKEIQRPCQKRTNKAMYLCVKRDKKIRKLINDELYQRTVGKFRRF